LDDPICVNTPVRERLSSLRNSRTGRRERSRPSRQGGTGRRR
jgi:hypothetical protein